MRESVSDGKVNWEVDRLAEPISKLPQIFWKNGEPWSEANHWALTKAQQSNGSHIKTVTALMKHLNAYASWIELEKVDWRHFPVRTGTRPIVRFRGELVKQRDLGIMMPSTVTARMNAVIQFYRHADSFGLVSRKTPMWKDEKVLLPYFTLAGFKRTMLLISSELRIPNKTRHGEKLEDGLFPLKMEDATKLLQFTDEEELIEIHLMLSLGILTGARRETISTLGINDLELARPEKFMPGFSQIRVGPGTGVKTKFSVSGNLLIPNFLLESLRNYAYSMRRLARQAQASSQNRDKLFLTVRGNLYEPPSFNRLMTDLRRRAISRGLLFMNNFKFHQTRATYGTLLMEISLKASNTKAAIAFVRDAMFHKHESMTLRYVRFIENNPIKQNISKEFSQIFSGIINRDWNKFYA